MKWYLWLSLMIAGSGIGWLAGLSVSPVVAIMITSVIGAATAFTTTLGDWSGKLPKSEGGALSKKTLNPVPLSLLVIGIFVGSISGVYARTRNWLGAPLSTEIVQWTDLGLPKTEVVHRLFNLAHPDPGYAHRLADLTAQRITTTTLSSEINVWTAHGLPKEEVARRFFEITYPLPQRVPPPPSTNKAQPELGLLYSDELTGCDLLFNYLHTTQDRRLTAAETNDFRNRVAATQFNGVGTLIEDSELLRKVLEALCIPGL